MWSSVGLRVFSGLMLLVGAGSGGQVRRESSVATRVQHGPVLLMLGVLIAVALVLGLGPTHSESVPAVAKNAASGPKEGNDAIPPSWSVRAAESIATDWPANGGNAAGGHQFMQTALGDHIVAFSLPD